MKPRTATADECDQLWPAVSSERLMDSPEELRAYWEDGPWRVRVMGRGEAALLGVWRLHLDVLAIRGTWASASHVPTFAHDAIEMARCHGFGRVLSPLLPAGLLGGYREVGMEDVSRIVAIQGIPDRMGVAAPQPGLALRGALPGDVDVLARLDAACFDDFWRYGAKDLAELISRERCMLAETTDGEIIGYTLATATGSSAVLSRLCTAPHARRAGIGSFLLSDVGVWCRERHASTIALCTQEENAASRALYSSAGLVEIAERYAFAMREV